MSKEEYTWKGKLMEVAELRELLADGISFYIKDPKQTEKVIYVSLTDGSQTNLKFPYTRGVDNWQTCDGYGEAIGYINAYFAGGLIKVGDSYLEWINQAWRSTYVKLVMKKRFRVVFEMPHAGYQMGWRRGVIICGQMYYPGWYAEHFTDMNGKKTR